MIGLDREVVDAQVCVSASVHVMDAEVVGAGLGHFEFGFDVLPAFGFGAESVCSLCVIDFHIFHSVERLVEAVERSGVGAEAHLVGVGVVRGAVGIVVDDVLTCIETDGRRDEPVVGRFSVCAADGCFCSVIEIALLSDCPSGALGIVDDGPHAAVAVVFKACKVRKTCSRRENYFLRLGAFACHAAAYGFDNVGETTVFADCFGEFSCGESGSYLFGIGCR